MHDNILTAALLFDDSVGQVAFCLPSSVLMTHFERAGVGSLVTRLGRRRSTASLELLLLAQLYDDYENSHPSASRKHTFMLRAHITHL